MIKLTKLSFEIKDEAHQRIEDIAAIYQEEASKADSLNLPIPSPPKPIRLKNKDYNIAESLYYVKTDTIEEIWHDTENTTMLSINGKEVSVKETVEEVFNLKEEYDKRKV